MESLADQVWSRLAAVTALSFVAKSQSSEKTGWDGHANGRVEVSHHSSDCMTFIETGSWTNPTGKQFEFSNTYQWTRETRRIRLEHLRFGPERPVYLFDLVADGPDRMISDNPHVCSEDLYSALLVLGDDINLRWTVSGPKLNESIEYRYREQKHESDQS